MAVSLQITGLLDAELNFSFTGVGAALVADAFESAFRDQIVGNTLVGITITEDATGNTAKVISFTGTDRDVIDVTRSGNTVTLVKGGTSISSTESPPSRFTGSARDITGHTVLVRSTGGGSQSDASIDVDNTLAPPARTNTAGSRRGSSLRAGTSFTGTTTKGDPRGGKPNWGWLKRR